MKPILLAAVSDLHAGSTVALCPPKIPLDDGGEFVASQAQLWLWACWHQYWRQIDELRERHAAELWLLLNGDVVEGDHHQTPQIISRNPEAQATVLREVLNVPLRLGPARIFVVRGTETHTGPSACAEEGLARGWRDAGRPIVADPQGTASWWHLRAEIHGTLLDVAHHGRTGFREHTRGSAASLHAADIFLSHARRGERHPDLCLRAHWHRFNDSHDAQPTRVVTSGAWQLKTGYAHKRHADTLADIGGLAVLFYEGRYDLHKIQFRAERGPIWRPE